jgi:hypothetical protein
MVSEGEMAARSRSVFLLTWLKQRATVHRRGLALAGLAAVELLLLLPVTLAVLCGAVPAVRSARRLPMLCRRLAGAWTGVDIADPYLPEPAAPPARKDGLYRFGGRLYRSRSRCRGRQRPNQPIHGVGQPIFPQVDGWRVRGQAS